VVFLLLWRRQIVTPRSQLCEGVLGLGGVAKGVLPSHYVLLRSLYRIGSPEEHQSDAKILPLSISRDTIEHIRRAWYLPTELLRMMLSTLPMAIEFSTSDENESPIMGKRQ
jgi:hypothetical protein